MKLLNIVIPCILLTMTIHANTIAERQELAIKVVEAMHGAEINLETFRNSCMTNMEQELKKHQVSQEDLTLLRKASAETVATITRERFVEAMAMGYAERLTLDELKGVLAFYESPSGKALRREQSEITKDTNARMKMLVAGMIKVVMERYEILKKISKDQP